MSSIIGVGAHVYGNGKVPGGPSAWGAASAALGSTFTYDFVNGSAGVNRAASGPDIDTFVDTVQAPIDPSAGDGLLFNGTSAYCTAPDDPTNRDMMFGTNGWCSFEATVRTPASYTANVEMIMTKGPLINAGWECYYSSTQTVFLFQWSNYSGYVTGPALATDTLYHLVWCMDKGAHTSHQVYYNSVLQTPTYPGNGPGGTQGTDSSKDLMFGARANKSDPLDHFHQEGIYGCAAYNGKQLTQQEVSDLYALALV